MRSPKIFLSGLTSLIRKEQIDAVLVSGDIFDTGTPGNGRRSCITSSSTGSRQYPGLQAIVTGGNHDSPSLLDAPQALLKHLRIHVFGSITEHAEDEIVEIADREGRPSLIVCAVPYLRDRDIRLSEPGESIEDKTRKMEEGVQAHYRAGHWARTEKTWAHDRAGPDRCNGPSFCQAERLFLATASVNSMSEILHGSGRRRCATGSIILHSDISMYPR